MHASGGHRLTSLLDFTPMGCHTTQILNGFLIKAGWQANLPVVAYGKSYAVDTLASSCAASFSSLLEACDLDTMVASLVALNASLPSFGPGPVLAALRGQCTVLASTTRPLA